MLSRCIFWLRVEGGMRMGFLARARAFHDRCPRLDTNAASDFLAKIYREGYVHVAPPPAQWGHRGRIGSLFAPASAQEKFNPWGCRCYAARGWMFPRHNAQSCH